MPTFTYTARNRAGARVRSTIVADNRDQAAMRLSAQGLTPEKLVETKTHSAMKIARLNRRVKSHHLLVFTRQLSTIVSSGLPLMQGLDILAEQAEDPNFAKIIAAISEEVESGETFSDSLRKFTRAFPELYVSMVRAGEAGGDLDGVLEQLANYLEASEELRRRIRSAMTYPVVAFSMIIMIAAGLIIFVVPQFAGIFEQMGGKLPRPTQILIDISHALRTWQAWAVLIGGAGGLTMFLRVYGKTPSGKYTLDSLKLRVPIFGMLGRKVAISRVTRTLSTLTRSGVAILQAMEIVERTAGNEVYAKAIREAEESVRSGETLAEPLVRAQVFPAMVTRMIAVGEKTGALETMLAKIADFYDSEVRATVDALTSLIEPLLIGLMGVVVGFIVLALFMPIFTMTQLVQ